MKGSAILLIVVGLIVLYIGVTGRLGCFGIFADCLTSPATEPGTLSDYQQPSQQKGPV
jgi:hypothetical protein